MRAIILADDLTGACDTAVAFPGAVVVVREPPPPAEVLAYSTNSRNDCPEEAASKVAALCARLPPAAILFKKVDSMMRGNVAAEVAAVPRRPGLVCPAFPEQGRTVIDGRSLPANVDLRALFAGIAGVTVVDASTTGDLKNLAALALAQDPAPLLVGSAGLARAIGGEPRRCGGCAGSATPVLCVGSTHEATLRQVEYLWAHCTRGFELWEIETRRPAETQLAMLRAAVSARRTGGLFLCGGDTALLVCEALGVGAIRMEAEVAPGVPMGWIEGGLANGLALITKSGGFGSPNTLACVVDVLSGHNRKDEPIA